MRLRLLICFTISLFATVCGVAQTTPQMDAPKAAALQSDASTTYAETPDGLQKLVQNLFDEEKTGDANRSSNLYTNLVIPNHSQWFAKTFGEPEGHRLESKYDGLLQVSPSSLKKTMAIAAEKGQSNVAVKTFQKPDDAPTELIRAFLVAMASPTSIYGAAMNSGPEDKSRTLLGDFVYVDGGFRYVDFGVMQALSTAPAMRVRLSGNVQRPDLINEVKPVYPEEAKANGIQGTVKLHVVLAKDGSVRLVEPVSGDSQLVQAAIDAVKQWRYKPTLLNGQPIEVGTEVIVVFALKH